MGSPIRAIRAAGEAVHGKGEAAKGWERQRAGSVCRWSRARGAAGRGRGGRGAWRCPTFPPNGDDVVGQAVDVDGRRMSRRRCFPAGGSGWARPGRGQSDAGIGARDGCAPDGGSRRGTRRRTYGPVHARGGQDAARRGGGGARGGRLPALSTPMRRRRRRQPRGGWSASPPGTSRSRSSRARLSAPSRGRERGAGEAAGQTAADRAARGRDDATRRACRRRRFSFLPGDGPTVGGPLTAIARHRGRVLHRIDRGGADHQPVAGRQCRS